jgi:L-threonylcarbamoyladenylate synthase
MSSSVSPHLVSATEAAKALIRGEVVALPTETVYGLAANIQDENALKKIFEWKGRPSQNPLIVHIAHPMENWWDRLVHDGIIQETKVRPEIEKIASKFWPGPLTLLLPKGPNVSSTITAGSPFVAVRMPDHPIFQAVLRESGLSLAAPSANRSGHTSATQAEHVRSDFHDFPLKIVEGGTAQIGLESTIVLIREEEPQTIEILRPGRIGRSEFENLGFKVREVSAQKRETDLLLSPGQLSRHYAISVPTFWVSPAIPMDQKTKKSGLLQFQESVPTQQIFASVRKILIQSDNLESWQRAAQKLYSVFREFESEGLEVLWVEKLPETSNPAAKSIRSAMLNRLEKSVTNYSII